MSSIKKNSGKSKILKLIKNDDVGDKIVSIVENVENLVKPTTIKLNDTKYYDAEDLKEFNPVYFFGCGRTVRTIIEKKNISLDNFIFANKSKIHGWRMVENQKEPPLKARLLLSETWVNGNISGFTEDIDIPDNECMVAPDILILEPHEQFKNADNEPIYIETRGSRGSFDKIYFKSADIAVAFKMDSLNNTVTHNDGGFERHEHYETFLCKNTGNPMSTTKKKNTVKKQLFLTYMGVIKVLFTSRSGDARKFTQWASKILFTVQMGTPIQKIELAISILGIPANTLRSILKKSIDKVSCVYRFAIGTCKNLRQSMNISPDIPDDHIIVKFGRTDDFDTRTRDHVRMYEKPIKGAKLELLGYALIDQSYVSKAETSLDHFFSIIAKPVKYHDHTEIVAISPDPEIEKHIVSKFKEISAKYSGDVEKTIILSEKKISDMTSNAKIASLEHHNKIQELESQIMKYKYELKLKDAESNREIEQYKNKVLMLTNKMKSDREDHLKEQRLLLQTDYMGIDYSKQNINIGTNKKKAK
jgi:hypothetical protein